MEAFNHWLFGVMFIVLGIDSLQVNKVRAGIFLILSGIAFIPRVQKLADKLNGKPLNAEIKYWVIALLVLIAML